MDGRRWAVAAAASASVTVLLAGCGGSARRDAANAYVLRVNGLSADVRLLVGNMNVAYRALAGGKPTKAAGFVRAERSLARYERGLRRLHPPDDARRLHRDLLALADAERRFAHEVALYARYRDAVPPVTRSLGAASARARTKLARERRPADQERTLRGYAAALAAAEAGLDRMQPPPALLPQHTAQHARVDRLRRLVLRIADALHRRERAQVAALSADLSRAPGADVIAAARAEAAAVRAYNGRLRRIYVLSARVDREHAALERRLQ